MISGVLKAGPRYGLHDTKQISDGKNSGFVYKARMCAFGEVYIKVTCLVQSMIVNAYDLALKDWLKESLNTKSNRLHLTTAEIFSKKTIDNLITKDKNHNTLSK